MSKFITTVLLILVLIIPSNFVRAEGISSYQNTTNFSTWLWDTSKITKDSKNILDFLVVNKVSTLYLQIDYNINYSYYKNFISQASKYNIKVEALDGSPDWVSTNTGLILQNKFFNWVTKYQGASLPNQRFTGIHLDVEPYENQLYTTNTNEILENYQAFLVKSINKCKALNLTLGIDIPFWFYGVKYNNKYGAGDLATWIFKKIKTVSIMAYRDTASGDNGIIQIAKREMDLCKKYNVNATIAVETGSLPDTPFVTFYEESKNYMFEQLTYVNEAFSSNPSFNGFAIHYLDSWKNMN